MKASALNRLFPNLDSRKVARFERKIYDAFQEALAEEATKAAERFSAKAHPHTLRAALEAAFLEPVEDPGRPIRSLETVIAAAPTPASAMVAVYPSDEQAVALAQLGGEPAEELHVTLAFLGELEPDQAEAAAAIVQKVAREYEPLLGMVGGVACFDDNGNGYPSIVLPDVHGLAELRHAVVTALNDAGIQHMTNHGWTPHLTIAYEEEAATPPEWMLGQPLTFEGLTFAQGDRRRDFELANGRIAAGGLGGMPLPPIYEFAMTDDELVAAIYEAAEANQPDEPAYGATAYDVETKTVHWISWDGTSNDEIEAAEAAFLAIDGVENFEYEAEGLTDGWPFENVIYPDLPPRWVVEPNLTAAGPPAEWTKPQPDELVDVEALIRKFRTKTDPVRLAVVETVADPAIRGFSASAAKAADALNVETIAKEDLDALLAKARILAASNDPREAFVGRTIVGYDGRGTLGVIRNAEGALQGAIDLKELRSTGEVFVDGVGSTVKGGGTALMRFAAKEASARETGLALQPTESSVPFYRRLGMSYEADSNTYRFTAGEAATFAGGGAKALDLGTKLFDTTNPFIGAVTGKTGQHITSIADTTRLNVMRIVRTSYEQGLTIPDTAKAIQEGMLAASETRATLIARTEMVGLVNGASLAATQIVADELAADSPDAGDGETGGAIHKQWLTAPGAKDPRHETYEGLDGMTLPLEAFFDVGGDKLQYPGDPDGDPAEVCNCRCTLVYIDAAGEETDAEVTAALTFPDVLEEGGDDVRVGKSKTAEAETLALALPRTEEETLALAETLAPEVLDSNGDPIAPMTAYVRIRPDMTEFRTEFEAGVRAAVADVFADLPAMVDVRPQGDTPEAEITPAPERENASQQRWEAVLAPEGKVTDDGRLFAPGSISWRELPLSLMAMTVTSEGGHVGAELAGRIERIWRDDSQIPNLIRAEGVFDDSAYGLEIARLVGDETLRGNSVDLAIREVEFGPASDYVDENGLWKADAQTGQERDPAEILFDVADTIMVATDAVIGMSTVCPFPAFEDAGIVLAAATETSPEFAIAADKTGLRWTIWLKDAVEPAEVITASAAGYAPVAPPAVWFEDPTLEELTPLTVTDDGQIYGHAWAWDVCHIGIPGTCTTAPSSESDYAYFLLKEVVSEEGERIPVGTITLGTGHASRNLGSEAAAEHYDHTGSAVADVVIGEDEFGGWIAGALRPDVAAARAREFRGSVLSGDWRRVEGSLELVGLLAVNVPGFPVPRAKALVAAADEETSVLSLTAAGVVVPIEVDSISPRSRLAALAARASGGLVALAELAATPFEAPAPRSKPERLLAALTAAGEPVDGIAGPVSTYELTQGSLAHRKFLSTAIEAGYSELTRASWPSEAELADPAEAEILFRQGCDGVYRLADGSVVYACVEGGWASFQVAAPSRAAGAEKLAAFSVEYPPLYRQAAETTEVPITFWTLGQFGPTRRLRLIDSATWDEISPNYSTDVRDEITRLVADDFEPGKNGQLLIWTGPPGTGKTWALRALATEWSDWAEFSYITDPDAFFVKDPSYMIDVLLHDAYESLTVEGDVVTDGSAGEKWRILILEDTGELLSANAKQESGQGLSRLLNVVDGMVGQGLRVLAIVTTNDEIEGFHPAVTRPGRCASQIAFGALSAEEAASWLSVEAKTVEGPMTLAELYQAAGTARDALAEEAEEIPERDHEDDPEPEDARDLMAAGEPA